MIFWHVPGCYGSKIPNYFGPKIFIWICLSRERQYVYGGYLSSKEVPFTRGDEFYFYHVIHHILHDSWFLSLKDEECTELLLPHNSVAYEL